MDHVLVPTSSNLIRLSGQKGMSIRYEVAIFSFTHDHNSHNYSETVCKHTIPLHIVLQQPSTIIYHDIDLLTWHDSVQAMCAGPLLHLIL